MATSHEEYRARLIRFAQTVPNVLARHNVTAHLGLAFQRLGLEEQFNRKFTLAVMGRMRSGKSTLINALIERHLAPVDVNETTATINWFDYGTAEQERRFDVHWKSEPNEREERPIEDIEHFLGLSQLAAKVDHLQFNAESPFLRNTRLVDTPGRESVNSAHDESISEYLNRKSGEKADAIVIVLGQMISADNRSLLDDFSEHSRLPGQRPYNTIAVFQKWETANVFAPEETAQQSANEILQRLDGKVAEVMPVSGLLAIMARQVPVHLFDQLALLAQSVPEDLEYITKKDTSFERERNGLLLTGPARKALFESIANALTGGQPSKIMGTWAMVRFAIGIAQRQGISNGQALARKLLELSNIEQLEALLRRRIFARQELIRSGNILAKALEPCDCARNLLRKERERWQRLVKLGNELETQIGIASTEKASALSDRIGSYIRDCQSVVGTELQEVEDTLRELEVLISDVSVDFRLLLTDSECLDLLENEATLSVFRTNQLDRKVIQLFGGAGIEPYERLGLSQDAPSGESKKVAAGLLKQMGDFRWFPEVSIRTVADHAEVRLNKILNEAE